MAELGGLRNAIDSVTTKLGELKSAIESLKSNTVVQSQIDEIQASVEEIGATVDELIADAKGETTTDVPGTTEPAP
jgi:methyl-accepting chemotaxis protein